MTIASKTRLLNFQFINGGKPFIEISTRVDLDATESQHFGAPFFGVGNTETLVLPNVKSFTRQGSPFNEVTTRSDIDSSYGTGRIRFGVPFVVKFAGTSIFPSSKAITRFGAPFRDITAKSSIDASEFDYSRLGAPFWVKYEGGEPPVVFDASRFFLMF